MVLMWRSRSNIHHDKRIRKAIRIFWFQFLGLDYLDIQAQFRCFFHLSGTHQLLMPSIRYLHFDEINVIYKLPYSRENLFREWPRTRWTEHSNESNWVPPIPWKRLAHSRTKHFDMFRSQLHSQRYAIFCRVSLRTAPLSVENITKLFIICIWKRQTIVVHGGRIWYIEDCLRLVQSNVVANTNGHW